MLSNTNIMVMDKINYFLDYCLLGFLSSILFEGKGGGKGKEREGEGEKQRDACLYV